MILLMKIIARPIGNSSPNNMTHSSNNHSSNNNDNGGQAIQARGLSRHVPLIITDTDADAAP